MITRLICALSLMIPAYIHADDGTVTPADLAKYGDCVTAATAETNSPNDLIKACREPAEAGIPGAQYAFGLGFMSRNEAGDRTAGIQWLEKAAVSGNPAAEFALAGILLQEQSPASVERGRVLLRNSVCSGYPPGVAVLDGEGITRDKLRCAARSDEDFSGEWIADLKWVKIDPMVEGGPQLKLLFTSNSSVQVFMKSDSDWTEVKAGQFKVTHLEEVISVSSVDSGWDFDGKWIESWTVQLLRTGSNDARVTFLRTVNNPHVPAAIKFRTFSTLAEGNASRRSH